MNADNECLTLNNGVRMPLVGYGVFQVDPKETERCVLDAIGAGYRLIDTAQAYGNEEGVGAAVAKCGLPRCDLFLTTKVWVSHAGEEKAAASIDESLRKLRTDYIDLLLIHQRYGDYHGTWRAMRKALSAGKVRAIGLSNFDQGRIADLVLSDGVKPAVLQVQTNVFCQQRSMEEFLKPYGTAMTAWAPLTEASEDFFSNPILAMAAEAHGKTVAQVALRWLIQRGIAVIPKTVRRERMEQNLAVFDFELSEAEMAAIATLNRTDSGTVAFDDPKFISWLIRTYA